MKALIKSILYAIRHTIKYKNIRRKIGIIICFTKMFNVGKVKYNKS